MSQTTYSQYKNNPNTVSPMSRSLHSHVNTMNKGDGIPTFAVEYVGHNDNAAAIILNGKQYYDTTVKVVFRTEVTRSSYARIIL